MRRCSPGDPGRQADPPEVGVGVGAGPSLPSASVISDVVDTGTYFKQNILDLGIRRGLHFLFCTLDPLLKEIRKKMSLLPED